MGIETKNRIMEEAGRQFFKYGIKSVSIDDITYGLSMSKKTFYENFKNKNELVEAIASDFLKRTLDRMERVKEEKNVIDEIIGLYSFMLDQFKSCNVSFIYDIKKYYPDIFKVYNEFIDNALKNLFVALIVEGKKEGLFIEDIDEKVIFSMHWKRFNNIIERELLPGKDLYDPVFSKIMKLSLIGISTLKGHQIIEEKFKQPKL